MLYLPGLSLKKQKFANTLQPEIKIQALACHQTSVSPRTALFWCGVLEARKTTATACHWASWQPWPQGQKKQKLKAVSLEPLRVKLHGLDLIVFVSFLYVFVGFDPKDWIPVNLINVVSWTYRSILDQVGSSSESHAPHRLWLSLQPCALHLSQGQVGGHRRSHESHDLRNEAQLFPHLNRSVKLPTWTFSMWFHVISKKTFFYALTTKIGSPKNLKILKLGEGDISAKDWLATNLTRDGLQLKPPRLGSKRSPKNAASSKKHSNKHVMVFLLSQLFSTKKT